MQKKLPSHIARLLFLLGFFLLFALAAKYYLTDSSFYKFGHYRADAVPELASGDPLYKGAAYCLECHEQRKTDWSVNAHVAVQCEVCHGTNRELCLNPDHEGNETVRSSIPADTIRLCTTCHLELPSRPATQPQIVLGEHPISGEETPQCYTCHDPHSPSNEEPAPEDAAPIAVTEPSVTVAASVAKCARCHGKQGQGRNRTPAIAGMEAAVFIEQMNKYKSGAIENKAMARYAKALSDEEIAELANYYEGLPIPATD